MCPYARFFPSAIVIKDLISTRHLFGSRSFFSLFLPLSIFYFSFIIDATQISFHIRCWWCSRSRFSWHSPLPVDAFLFFICVEISWKTVPNSFFLLYASHVRMDIGYAVEWQLKSQVSFTHVLRDKLIYWIQIIIMSYHDIEKQRYHCKCLIPNHCSFN